VTETVLDNPLVREYLRALDIATATLPAAQARELREQITAHLDEALPPGAADDEVKAELDRLGPPEGLAAEAVGPGPRSAGQRLLRRLFRIRWWVWTLIAAVATAIIAGAVLLTLMQSAAPLNQDGGLSGWWFDEDGARSVTTLAGSVTQRTVPERYGQRQGFVVSISNDSDWTQTILGPESDPLTEAFFGVFSLGVSGPPGPGMDVGPDNRQLHWDLPASIPPHSDRFLRVLWTSGICMGPGSQTVVTDLFLRVRVGIITRTEDIHLQFAWALSGAEKSGCVAGERVILGS
jgi:hypothetical protein